MSSSEGAAISLLKRACDLDSKKRYTEALVCYQEGLQLLMDVIRTLEDENRKQSFRKSAADYMSRAEKLRDLIEAQKRSGKFHEQIRVEANSVGNSYEKLFGRFLDEHVTEVQVEDPYVRSHHQVNHHQNHDYVVFGT